MSDDGRWPRWVYRVGEDPDYRFSFANERTFLAWIRTALALVAGGVALESVHLSWSSPVQHALALGLLVLGGVCSLCAWRRWSLAERAMRRGQPLPSSRLSSLVAVGVVALSVGLLVAM